MKKLLLSFAIIALFLSCNSQKEREAEITRKYWAERDRAIKEELLESDKKLDKLYKEVLQKADEIKIRQSEKSLK